MAPVATAPPNLAEVVKLFSLQDKYHLLAEIAQELFVQFGRGKPIVIRNQKRQIIGFLSGVSSENPPVYPPEPPEENLEDLIEELNRQHGPPIVKDR